MGDHVIRGSRVNNENVFRFLWNGVSSDVSGCDRTGRRRKLSPGEVRRHRVRHDSLSTYQEASVRIM